MLELLPPPPPSPEKPIVLGLLGGIASGKSTVARALQDRGFLLIDADRIAKDLLGVAEIRGKLVHHFGPQILDKSGEVDRRMLAERVFTEESERKFLERLLHPRVRKRIEKELDRAIHSGRPSVLDVPLLLEGGLHRLCDVLVFVEVPEELRQARASSRGMDPGDWAAREELQASMEEKRGVSHFQLTNQGEKQDLLEEVEALLGRLRALGFLHKKEGTS